MAQFTKTQPVNRHSGVIATTSQAPTQTTHGRGTGYTRTPKSELFLLAVTFLYGKDTFYEGKGARFSRFLALFKAVLAEDDGPAWLSKFIPWLRDEAGIRTAATVAAVEYAREVKGTEGRKVLGDTLQRGDEPAEALGYHLSTYGKRIPKAVKNGIADAAVRLYSELTILKYDSSRATVRPGDVIALTHPKPTDAHQDAVFTALLDRRHGRTPKPETLALLPRVSANAEGEHATWEQAAGAGNLNWNAQIMQGMGVMATLRNLRNFDKEGIDNEAVAAVKALLTNKDAVRKSRVFPLRFLSAWDAVDSMRWAETLETGLEHSLENVPMLGGKTLVLWDVSGSMSWGDPAMRIPAGVFATALSRRAETSWLYAYDTSGYRIPVSSATSVLRTVQDAKSVGHGGTYTWNMVKALLAKHAGADRVVIVTDEQAHDQINKSELDAILGQRTCHVLNVTGYQPASAPSERVISFGGLNDRMFTAIVQAEQGLNQVWPWEEDSTG